MDGVRQRAFSICKEKGWDAANRMNWCASREIAKKERETGVFWYEKSKVVEYDGSESIQKKCDLYRDALREIESVAVDFGHYEDSARTMHEIAQKAIKEAD